jgi:aryl-alcohol dehydrogenase-like predicted oxidoreductase
MGALDSAVRQGKALYVGISSYSADATAEAARILRELGTPLLIHQPSYSMLNRWIEASLLDVLQRVWDRLHRLLAARSGAPDRTATSMVYRGLARRPQRLAASEYLSEEKLARVRRAAGHRDQARPVPRAAAIAWVLRDERVTSALVGEQRRPARAQPRRAEQPPPLGRRAHGDRPVRGRRRHQPLGGVEHCLKPLTYSPKQTVWDCFEVATRDRA